MLLLMISFVSSSNFCCSNVEKSYYGSCLTASESLKDYHRFEFVKKGRVTHLTIEEGACESETNTHLC